MPKYTIDFEATWQGKMEVEAESEYEAREAFYQAATVDNKLEINNEEYYPYTGKYEITDVTEHEDTNNESLSDCRIV